MILYQLRRRVLQQAAAQQARHWASHRLFPPTALPPLLPQAPLGLHFGASWRRIESVSYAGAAVAARVDGGAGACALSPDGAIVFVSTSSKGEPAAAGSPSVHGLQALHALSFSAWKLRWVYEYPVAACTNFLPSPDCSLIFFGTRRGDVHAVDASSGEQRWQHDIPHSTPSAEESLPRALTLTPDGSSLLFGTSDGQLCCLASSTGELRWSYVLGQATPDGWSFHVSPDGNLVVFWAGDGQLHALHVADGSQRWIKSRADAVPFDWTILTTPDGATLLYATCDGHLHALAAASGETRWSHKFQRECELAACVIIPSPDGARVVLGTTDGKVRSFFAVPGEIGWSFEARTPLALNSLRMSRDGARIFLATCDGTLRALAASSGEVQWTSQIGNTLDTDWSMFVSPDDARIVYCSSDGMLRAVSAADGQLGWQQKLGSDIPIAGSFLTTPDGSTLVFLTCSGKLCVRSLGSGEIPAGKEQLAAADNATTAHDARPRLLRGKRVAVLLALLGVLAMRRLGWLKLPTRTAEEQLQEGADAHALLAKILGQTTADAVLPLSGDSGGERAEVGCEVSGGKEIKQVR